MAEARPEKQRKINGEKGLYYEYSEMPYVRTLVNKFLGTECSFGRVDHEYACGERFDYITGNLIPISKRITTSIINYEEGDFCGFCGSNADDIYDNINEIYECCTSVGCETCAIMLTGEEFDIHRSFKFQLKNQIEYEQYEIKRLGIEIKKFKKDTTEYEKIKNLLIETQETLFGLKWHHQMEDA